MKSTGIIRKIDDLGRIVIPKEIRNSLKIKENDNLEIYVENDKIVLNKFNKLESYEELAKNYIKIFDKVFNINLIVTDCDKVLFSSNQKLNELIGVELSKDFSNILNERKTIIDKTIKQLNWFKDRPINSCTIIFPIIENIELLGAVILISDKKVNDVEIAIAKLYSMLIKQE